MRASITIVYAGVDNYLEEGGRLGFVITQSVFKTKGAGDGFRQLSYSDGQKTVYLKPLIVHDLSELQVFEGATNRTAVFVCEKRSRDFKYPVPYVQWHGPSRIGQEEWLEDVIADTERVKLGAEPVNAEKTTSPWLTAPKAALSALRKVIGPSDYKAYEGVNTGGLNGCFWVRILQKLPNGLLLIENLNDVGKIKIDRVEASIEPDLVYPLVRGRDVERWYAKPSAHIILAQDPSLGKGVPEAEMKRKYRKTYAYFKEFEGSAEKRGTLRGRALFKQYYRPTDPFYSMYNVGEYSLAPWKVAWTRVGTEITAAVMGAQEDGRPILTLETVTFVPFESKAVAHYFCAAINSAPSRAVIESYSSKSTGSFGSPHVLDHVRIRTFDPESKAHRELSECSLTCHELLETANPDTNKLRRIQNEIDRLAAGLWGVTKEELRAVEGALGSSRERPSRQPAASEDVE